MRGIIEISGQDLEEIIKALPKHLKDKLKAMVRPSSNIEILKEFIEKYEDDCIIRAINGRSRWVFGQMD
jgi:hypothetical protein